MASHPMGGCCAEFINGSVVSCPWSVDGRTGVPVCGGHVRFGRREPALQEAGLLRGIHNSSRESSGFLCPLTLRGLVARNSHLKRVMSSWWLVRRRRTRGDRAAAAAAWKTPPGTGRRLPTTSTIGSCRSRRPPGRSRPARTTPCRSGAGGRGVRASESPAAGDWWPSDLLEVEFDPLVRMGEDGGSADRRGAVRELKPHVA